MIRPDQVTNGDGKPARYKRDMEVLERAYDAAIRTADVEGKWPARVLRMRTPICVEAYDDTAAKYSAAGWRVNRCAADCIAEIDVP